MSHYSYTYPLVEVPFLQDLIEERVGIRPIGISGIPAEDKTVIYFERELTSAEKSTLDSLMDSCRTTPPTLYQYSQQADLGDAKADIEATTGVKPLRAELDDQGRLMSVVFERELTSREEDSLKPLLGKNYRKLVKRKL